MRKKKIELGRNLSTIIKKNVWPPTTFTLSVSPNLMAIVCAYNRQKKNCKLTVHANFKKSRIRETKNLSTDADSRTVTVSERFHDLS